MEVGKLSEALLSKSYTVALLYLCAAAAKQMKEAEVVKKKKVEGEEETGRGGVGAPSGWEETLWDPQPFMGALSLS